MALPEHPQLVPDVVVRQEGSLTLLLSPGQGAWCVVDQAGYDLARACTGNRDQRALAGGLVRRYGIAQQRAEQDVSAYLEQLLRAGLLVGEAPASPARPSGEEGRDPAAARSGGLRVALLVTAGCNLSCRHCYKSPAAEAADGSAVPLAVLRARLDHCVEAGAVGVTLSGGEILTHPDWRDVVGYAAQRLRTTVTTNAVLVDDEVAASFAANGVFVQVSLDGPEAETHEALRGEGSFAAAMAGIRQLMEHGLGARMTWAVCINRHNLSRIGALMDLALEMGVGRVYLLWLAPRGSAAAHWPDLAVTANDAVGLVRSLRSRLSAHPERFVLAGCPGPAGVTCPLETGETALIDVDGSIYPCILLGDPQFRLGHADAEGLAAALRSPAAEKLRASVSARVERVRECRACGWRRLCRSACPGLAWMQNEDWWRADDLCGMRRERYAQAALDRARELMRSHVEPAPIAEAAQPWLAAPEA